MTTKKSNTETRAFWRTLIADQVASGLCVAKYCREKMLSANLFYRWKRKLSSQSIPDDHSASVQIVQSVPKKSDESITSGVASAKSDHRPLFAPVRVKDDEHASATATGCPDIGSPIEIALRSGATIRVQRYFDSETLIRVLDCLEDRRC